MPLEQSNSRSAIGHNIKTEKQHGKPQKQAVAIALDTARRHGGYPSKEGADEYNAQYASFEPSKGEGSVADEIVQKRCPKCGANMHKDSNRCLQCGYMKEAPHGKYGADTDSDPDSGQMDRRHSRVPPPQGSQAHRHANPRNWVWRNGKWEEFPVTSSGGPQESKDRYESSYGSYCAPDEHDATHERSGSQNLIFTTLLRGASQLEQSFYPPRLR